MEDMEKTDAGGKLVSFAGSLRLLSQKEGLLQKVEVMLLNDEVNRNNWKYLNLEEHRKLFADTPLLVAYKGNKVGDGHNFDEVRNPDGTVTASFMSATAERIVGWFRSENDIRIETIGNKKWIVGTGYIWKWYAQELVAKLRGQGRGPDDMAVSIETLIDEMHMDGDTEVYTKYQILGTTILGDDVAPAVKDAAIRALSAIGTTGIREMTLRVASANPQPLGESENDQGEDHKSGSEEDLRGAQTSIKKGKLHMNSKIMKELTDLFPDYRIFPSENSVALCSADGDFYRVPYSVENGQVVPGAKVAVDAVVLVGEGEEAISVAFNEIRGEDVRKIAELTEKLADAEKSAKNANDTLDVMKKRENARRIKAVRDAINARYAEICENAEGADVCREDVDKLLADDKLSCYAAMDTEDGEFCGDEAARKDVDALCMEAVISAGKKNRENAAHRFAFDFPAEGSEGGDSIDALINRMSN